VNAYTYYRYNAVFDTVVADDDAVWVQRDTAPPQTEAVVTLYNFDWMDSHMLPVEAFATGIKILSAKLPKRLQTEQMELSIYSFWS